MATQAIPRVGAQVAARPVSLAVDNSQSRQLDILRGQLSAFTSGANNLGQAYEQKFATQEQQKAMVDHADNPYGAKPEEGSVYYYNTRMSLFGEKAGLDLQQKAAAEAQRVQDDPEALSSTDVGAHMDNFIKEQYKGLKDPVALEKVLGYAEKARLSTTSALHGAKVKQAKEQTYNDAYGVLHGMFETSTPEELTAAIPSFIQQYRGAVPERDLINFAYNLVLNKVSRDGASPEETTRLAAEAKGFLGIMNGVMPGMNTSLASIASQSDPTFQDKATKLNNLEANIQATQGKRAEAQQEADKKAFEADRKKKQKINSDNIASKTKMLEKPDDLIRLYAEIDLTDLDDVERNEARIAVNEKLAMSMKVEENGPPDFNAVAYDPELIKPAVKDEVDMLMSSLAGEQDKANMGEKFYATQAKLRKWGGGTALEHFNKLFFGGLSGAAVESFAQGGTQVDPITLARLEAWGKISRDGALQAGIPEADRNFGNHYQRIRETGAPPSEAVKVASAAVRDKREPLSKSQKDVLFEGFRNSVTTPVWGTNTSPLANEHLQTWLFWQTDSLRVHSAMGDKDIRKDLEVRYGETHVSVGSRLGTYGSAGVVNTEKPQVTVSVPGGASKTYDTALMRDEIIHGSDLFLMAMEAKGLKGTLVPVNAQTGEHKFVSSEKGNNSSVPISLDQLAAYGIEALAASRAAYKMERIEPGNPLTKGVEAVVRGLFDIERATPKQKKIMERMQMEFDAKKMRAEAYGENSNISNPAQKIATVSPKGPKPSKYDQSTVAALTGGAVTPMAPPPRPPSILSKPAATGAKNALGLKIPAPPPGG